jgi:hypothetical protein
MVLDLLLCLWLMLDLGRLIGLGPGNANKSRFAEAVLKGLSGEKGIITPTFVYLQGIPGGEEIYKETGCEFFSVPVELGVCLFLQSNCFSNRHRLPAQRRHITRSPTSTRAKRPSSRLV